jgi:hypothetical protein
MQGKTPPISSADQARLMELAKQYQAIASGSSAARGYYPAKGMLRTIEQVLKRQGKVVAVQNPREGKIVGWHTAQGTQYCTRCVPKKPKDSYPIRKGDPDWSYGSVPICKKCNEELDTVVTQNPPEHGALIPLKKHMAYRVVHSPELKRMGLAGEVVTFLGMVDSPAGGTWAKVQRVGEPDYFTPRGAFDEHLIRPWLLGYI